MALDTYSALKTSIADWLARPDLTSVIPDFVTLFEAHANRLLKVRQQNTTATITITSGVGTLPSDYLEWKRVTWLGSSYRNLEYVHPAYFAAQYPDNPDGVPVVFTIEGSQIKDMPTDSTSLEMLYAQKVPALSDSLASNWLLAAHPDAYLTGCMKFANAYMKDGNAAMAWGGEDDRILAEIIGLSGMSSGQAVQRSTQVTP